MKKILLSASLLLALGCSREEAMQNQQKSNSSEVLITVNATPSSRVSLTPDSDGVWKTAWESGDELSAWMISSSADMPKFTMKNIVDGSEGKSALFTGAISNFDNGKQMIKLIYPYCEGAKGGEDFTIDLASQTIDMSDPYNSLADKYLYLISEETNIYQYADVEEDPVMHHVVAAAQLAVKATELNGVGYTIDKIEINGLKSSGNCKIYNNIVTPAATPKQIDITVENAPALKEGEVLNIPFALIPFKTTASTAITFDIYMTDGAKYSKVTVTKDNLEPNLEVRAAQYTTFTANITGSDISGQIVVPTTPFEITAAAVSTPESNATSNNILTFALNSTIEEVSGDLKDLFELEVYAAGNASTNIAPAIESAVLSADKKSVTLTLADNLYCDDDIAVNFIGSEGDIKDGYGRSLAGCADDFTVSYFELPNSTVTNASGYGFEGAINGNFLNADPWWPIPSTGTALTSIAAPAEVATATTGTQLLQYHSDELFGTVCKYNSGTDMTGSAGDYVITFQMYKKSGIDLNGLEIPLKGPGVWVAAPISEDVIDNAPCDKWVTVYKPMKVSMDFATTQMQFVVKSSSGTVYFDNFKMELDTRRSKIECAK